MAQRVTLVAVSENADGSLTIQDANGNSHEASNAQSAWMLLKQILSDPTLPNMEEPSADQVDFEQFAADYVRSNLPPGLDQLAQPFVRSSLGFLQRLSRKNHSPRR